MEGEKGGGEEESERGVDKKGGERKRGREEEKEWMSRRESRR